MRPIFISYRREDTEGQAGRLFQDLREAFGEAAVFMDVATIEPGVDFRRAIEKHTATCGALLALIGRRWLTTADADGKRRLDDPHDFVRLETVAALQRDIPVIPVLVQDAQMVRAEDLPTDLQPLAFRNGVELTHARWDSDVQLLIKALRPMILGDDSEPRPAPTAAAPPPPPPPAPPPPPPPPRWRLWLATAAVVVAAGTGGGLWYAEHRRAAELAAQAAAAKAAAAKAIEDKANAEKAAADKVAADKAAADKAATDRAAAQRQAAAQRAEAERQTAERRKAAAAEAERLEAERRKVEAERQEAERVDAERRKAAADRAEAERQTALRREAQIRAATNGECISGYVWREAWAGDKVCVTPTVRSRTAAENAAAANTREPRGGAYGPNTCRQGYVWREARSGDVVCAVPASRDQARADNAAEASRRVPMPR